MEPALSDIKYRKEERQTVILKLKWCITLSVCVWTWYEDLVVQTSKSKSKSLTCNPSPSPPKLDSSPDSSLW